jgi:hypothetical protein
MTKSASNGAVEQEKELVASASCRIGHPYAGLIGEALRRDHFAAAERRA